MSKSTRARRAAERESFVLRPFEGMASECDLIAMREIVPAATTTLKLVGDHADRDVTLVTVLPLALPCLTRSQGAVLVAMQTQFPAGDAGRQISAALLAALAIDPGATPTSVEIESDTPQLQELIDPTVPLDITVHDGFLFWVENPDEMTPEIEQSLEQANAAAPPTARLTSVEAAYWSHERDKAWLRWVMPQDEAALLKAFARLHVARADSLGEGTRYVGAFRCQGLLAPVWELPTDREASDFEDAAKAMGERIGEALANDTPLTADERRARDGLASRQLTIR
ncbi:MAG TPA: DUF5926 family protein [Sporichthyaceae bacterium]|nr:DUF5926 family protein [Sporichthyaceae bacterium]